MSHFLYEKKMLHYYFYVLVSSVTAPLGVIDTVQECIQFLTENMHINLTNQHPSVVKREIIIKAESIMSSVAW